MLANSSQSLQIETAQNIIHVSKLLFIRKVFILPQVDHSNRYTRCGQSVKHKNTMNN